jgi:uncharacterized protein (DUF305 family)
MIATSTIVMFGVMYLNTYQVDHATYSETRTYMALLTGSTIAMVMLGFMLGMYPKRMLNTAIFVASALVFVVALWRAQPANRRGRSFMSAMIPHHPIAILTSERAQISDPRVRELADTINKTQRDEIAQMKALITDLTDGSE